MRGWCADLGLWGSVQTPAEVRDATGKLAAMTRRPREKEEKVVGKKQNERAGKQLKERLSPTFTNFHRGFAVAAPPFTAFHRTACRGVCSGCTLRTVRGRTLVTRIIGTSDALPLFYTNTWLSAGGGKTMKVTAAPMRS